MGEDFNAGTDASDSHAGNMDPTVRCSTCNREWQLTYELEELHAGNRALEQFALDHHRHTGHYPDDVSPWTADCQACPAEELYLEQRPAKRFGRTHARHTDHEVVVMGPDDQRVVIQGFEATRTEP
nr:hypothetical protein [Halovenus salina]